MVRSRLISLCFIQSGAVAVDRAAEGRGQARGRSAGPLPWCDMGPGGANPAGRGGMRYRVGIASVSTARTAGRPGPAGVRFHVGIASVSTPPSAGGRRRGAEQGMAPGGTGPVRTVAQRAAGEPEWTRHGWPGERVPGVVRFVVCALWVRHRKLNGREPSPVLPLTRPEAAPPAVPGGTGSRA